MTTDEEQRYGPKVNRLLRIRRLDSLGDLILPVFPIAPLPSAQLGTRTRADDRVSIYAAALEQAFPKLMQRVWRTYAVQRHGSCVAQVMRI